MAILYPKIWPNNDFGDNILTPTDMWLDKDHITMISLSHYFSWTIINISHYYDLSLVGEIMYQFSGPINRKSGPFNTFGQDHMTNNNTSKRITQKSFLDPKCDTYFTKKKLYP